MNYTKELFAPVLNQVNTSKKADAIESAIIQLTKEYVEVMEAIGNNNEKQVRTDLADLITKQSQ